MSRSSRSRSPSGSASGSKSDDENEFVEVVEDNNGGDMFTSAGQYHGYGARGGVGKYGWRRDDDDMSVGFSVREEDEEEVDVESGGKQEEEWDGMDMDMVMD